MPPARHAGTVFLGSTLSVEAEKRAVFSGLLMEPTRTTELCLGSVPTDPKQVRWTICDLREDDSGKETSFGSDWK